MKQPAVYIITNKPAGTLYVGVTSNLPGRISQHRSGQFDGFSQKYHLHHLVWFELFDDMANAIAHEKKLKKWPRKWKVDLIEQSNRDWRDLFDEIAG